MNESIRERVRVRADHCCEYCQLHQDDSPLARLHVEHIIPRKHGGTDDEANLALSCIDCNLHKGSNLTGIDPQSGQIKELFHPRRQRWSEHFRWEGIHIVGRTAVGRATIEVLAMNSDDQLALRSS
jgi:HNH endonuclease